MRMTFTQLAEVTRSDFAPVRWPKETDGSAPEVEAALLIDFVQRLAQHRPVSLFQRRTAIVSPRPADYLVACLFRCYGAKVHFLCPQQPVWNESIHGPLFQALVRQLGGTHGHLDLRNLRNIDAKSFVRTEGLAAELWSPSRSTESIAGRCDLVFARGLPEVGDETGKKGLAALAALAQVGGLVEVFGESRTAADDEALDRLVQESGLLGLGIQSASRAGSGTSRIWRLALTRLGAPSYEYPRGEEDHLSLQAHCMARLKFAARFVRSAEVLEAGCATGIGARLFRAEGANRVVGLDYDDDAIARARAATHDASIDYQKWDLNRVPLPVADASVDVVVCLEVLEHVEAQQALISDFLRVLRPGGRLVISVPNKEFEDRWIDINNCRNVYHVLVPGRDELQRLLASFADVQWARQVDLAGSTVLEEGRAERELVGTVSVPSGRLSLDPAMVFLAVCTKAPLAAAHPAAPAAVNLQLYENYLAVHQDWHRHSMEAKQLFALERWNRWLDQNRMAKATGQGQDLARGDSNPWNLDHSLREWVQGNAALYCCSPLRRGEWPGDWMRQFAVSIARVGAMPLEEEPHQGPWELWLRSDRFTVRPVSTRPKCAYAVFSPRTESAAGIRSLWEWSRTGATDAWFLGPEGWEQYDLLALLVHRLSSKTSRCLLRGAAPWLGLDRPLTRTWVMGSVMSCLGRWGPPLVTFTDLEMPDAGIWPSWLEHQKAGSVRKRNPGQPLRVVQYAGSLAGGESERQLCNLANALRKRGVDTKVLTTFELEKGRGQFRHVLRAGRVPYRKACIRSLTTRAACNLPWHLLRGVPPELRSHVLDLAAELARFGPDVLHCWLDQPNIIGFAAGMIAEVPCIVTSVRDADPTKLDRDFPNLRSWYRLAAVSPRVQFIANSSTSAIGYAEWIGVRVERFRVVFDSIDPSQFQEPTPEVLNQAHAGPSNGEERFDCERLVAETLALYALWLEHPTEDAVTKPLAAA